MHVYRILYARSYEGAQNRVVGGIVGLNDGGVPVVVISSAESRKSLHGEDTMCQRMLCAED